MSASIAYAAAVIPNGAKMFFAKGTATFINGPAILLNNDPKNPRKYKTIKFILKVVSIFFLSAFFIFFQLFTISSAFTLLYSIIYTNHKTFVVPL